MESPAAARTRAFVSYNTRDEYLNQHLVRLQVKVANGVMGNQCYVKVQGENLKVFPADKGFKSIFFCEFYTKKPEEQISVFFRVNGKDVYDNPRKRTVRCISDGAPQKKKLFGGNKEYPETPKFAWFEWLWGLNTSLCRTVAEEPRLRPSENSTAIICYSLDPNELKDPPAPSAGRGGGRGDGTTRPGADSPPTGPAPGRGRGMQRRNSVAGEGRGRGRGERRRSSASETEKDMLGLRRRSSGGSTDGGDMIGGGVPLKNSVVEASLEKFVEVQKSDGHHVLIATGGPQKGQLEPTSELLSQRLQSRAVARKHNSVRPQDILQEPYANHEFYTFCNLRLLLTKSGVGKCILVARDCDVERLLVLWTAVMVGLKISISTSPVPSPEATAGQDKREAVSKLSVIMEEIKKRTKC